MTWRQRVLAVVGALVLLGATPSAGLGHADDLVAESSVTILPGPLVATLSWVSFEKQFERTSGESQHGYLILRVLDERGYATGWNILMSTTGTSGPGTDQLTLVPGAVSTIRGNPEVAGHATFSVGPVRTIPSLLWSVPNHSGDGEYDLPLTSGPGSPGGQHKNGLYTIVVNIGGGAP